MTTPRRRPGGDQDGDGDRGWSVAEDTAHGDLGDDPDVLRVAFCAVDRVVRAAHRLYGGPLPVVGSPAWRAAPWIAQVATLCVLGEHWLLRDPDRIAADRIKAMAIDLSAGHDWTAASQRPSHGLLTARRAEPGPMSRWASTGTSREGVS